MGKVDLAIRNGRPVTGAGVGEPADIGIEGERVACIGIVPAARDEIDARGKLVLPGCIDAHVHLSYPLADEGEPGWVDDFTSGSAAALAGGVTTVGNICFPLPGETPLQTLEREEAQAREMAVADYLLHPVLSRPTPEVLADIPTLARYGCRSIKLFTVFPWFDQEVRGILEAVHLAGASGLLTLVHCEDRPLIAFATAQLVAEGKTGLQYYPVSRPVVSEVVATQRVVALAEVAGAPVHVVHLSSRRALEVCRDARRRGVPVHVETRPMYLHFTEDRFSGPDPGRFVGQPPLRTASDLDALWEGIAQGDIDTVATDHAPWLLADKIDPAHTIEAVRPGVADLETLLPVLYSEGVRSGRISLERLVQVLSTNAARLLGLFPRKGTIRVGSDADLVVFDPECSRVVDGACMHSRADYSVYDGWEVTGWPDVTVRRGAVVYRDGQVMGRPGTGRRAAAVQKG